MKGIIAALWRRTIWAPNAIPEKEWEYRNVKRMMLPGVYGALIIVGSTAAHLGIPALQELFVFPWASVLSLLVTFIALLAFIGTIFPTHWKLEAVSASFLFGAFVSYIVTIGALVSINHDYQRVYVGCLALVPLIVLLWRIYQLRDERIRRLAVHMIQGDN